jgi:hypothetical protein
MDRGAAMSRIRSKCEYAFRTSPLELEPEWHDPALSFYERMLGRELHVAIGDEPARFVGDWREFCCRKMQVHGRDRTSAKKALSVLLERGLVSINGDLVRVRFAPSRQSVGTQMSVSRHPDLSQVPENTQVVEARSDIEVEEKREIPPAGAHAVIDAPPSRAPSMRLIDAPRPLDFPDRPESYRASGAAGAAEARELFRGAYDAVNKPMPQATPGQWEQLSDHLRNLVRLHPDKNPRVIVAAIGAAVPAGKGWAFDAMNCDPYAPAAPKASRYGNRVARHPGSTHLDVLAYAKPLAEQTPFRKREATW